MGAHAQASDVPRAGIGPARLEAAATRETDYPLCEHAHELAVVNVVVEGVDMANLRAELLFLLSHTDARDKFAAIAQALLRVSFGLALLVGSRRWTCRSCVRRL